MPLCCFEEFLEKFTENFFFVKKLPISEKSTEILIKFFFLTMFEGVNPEENLDLFKQLYLFKPVKRDIY